MSTHTILIVINVTAVVAVLGFLFYRVLSSKRNPVEGAPENLEPFFDDEVLEGAHLERALGVALIALIVVIVGLLAYFIWEPFREADAADGFKERSIERGAILFANSQSKSYDSTKSLLCANCHGVDGGGGFAPPYPVKSEDPRCDPNQTVNQDLADKQPYCLPKAVSWAAPNLQLASLRYSRQQLTNIITYGRPGTPMPPWGVASGKGALQEQSIQDLVNYVESLGTTADKAQTAAAAEARNCDKGDPPAAIRGACVGKAQLEDPAVRAAAAKWVLDAQAELDAAQAGRTTQTTTDGIATYDKLVAQKTETLQVAQSWRDATLNATDGQILFMNNCARCHTRGWSYFDPTQPEANPPMGIMGGGAYGPNLTNGDVNNQFPPPTGEAELFAWISEGVPANEQYGIRGISSGRMPHFGAVLTKTQIESIMAYERSL
jgi:mono/diheme cytochrome c family protein